MNIPIKPQHSRCLWMLACVALTACCHRDTQPSPAHAPAAHAPVDPQDLSEPEPKRPGTGCPDCLLTPEAGTEAYWFLGNFAKIWDSSDFLQATDMVVAVEGTSGTRSRRREYPIDLSPGGRHVNTVFWQLIEDMDVADKRVTLTYTLDGRTYSEDLEIYR